MKPWMRTALLCVAIAVIVAVLTAAITITVMNRNKEDQVLLTTQEYEALNEFAPLDELADMIQEKHFGQNIEREELIRGAIDGMLDVTGDPYAEYFSQQEFEAYLSEINGKYHGIGALVGQPGDAGTVKVLKVYQDSPAEQAGLQAGDSILSINDVSLNGLTLEEISALLEGDADMQVDLEVLRGETPFSFSIARSSGTVRRVEPAKLFREGTGYIRIDMFSGNCVEEFREAILDLTERKMRSLVIDLRNNPGGELEKVVEMVDMILPEGLIVSVEGADGSIQEYHSDSKCIRVPFAVLVNGQSASASEIFAGAVQDHEAGLLVGTRTYGKGLVQSSEQLISNRGWVKLTTAAYRLPGGRNIDGAGVAPDIDIDLADDLKDLSIDQIDQDDDAQLWAALDEVREQADALDD